MSYTYFKRDVVAQRHNLTWRNIIRHALGADTL